MDPTDQEQESRRTRLREWLRLRGGHAEVVRTRQLTPSQASHLSQVVNGYSFGARAARSMEGKLGMPTRWLDAAQELPSGEHPPHRVEAHDLSLSLHYAGRTRTAERVPVRGTVRMGADGTFDRRAMVEPAGEIMAYSVDAGAYAVRVSGDALHPYASHGASLVIEPAGECVAGEPVVLHLKDGTSAVRELVARRDGDVIVQGIIDRRRHTYPASEVDSIEPIVSVMSASRWRPALP